MTKKRHSKAVREVADAIDRRLTPVMPSWEKEMNTEIVDGREPIIRITIRVKP